MVQHFKYHYDPFTIRPACSVAEILKKIFPEWIITGTDRKYLVQRQEIIEKGKLNIKAGIIFVHGDHCYIWKTELGVYLMNRVVKELHIQHYWD
jgi:hypothetical protein